MPLPATTYDTATATAPGSNQTDFTLLVDLSLMSSAWWAAVDTSDPTKGRAAKDDETELAVDWVDFDDTAETGWARILWSGTLASAGSDVLRIYPPVSGNASVAAGDTYGQYNAYNSGWAGYWPLGDLNNRCAATGHLTAYNSPTSGIAGKVGEAYRLDDASSQYLMNETEGPFLTDFPATIMCWARHNDFGATQPTPFCSGGNASEGYIRLRYNSGFKPQASMSGGTFEDSGGSLSVDTWYHLCARLTSSEIEAFVDSVGSGSPTSHSTTWKNNSASVVGARRTNTVMAHYMSGDVQECQMHGVERGDDWIAHEYNQSNDQSSFWGSWSNVPIVSASRRIIICS